MLKNQLFGVEVEFTGITRTEATEIVAEALSSTASPATGHPYYTRNIKDAKGRTWKIQRDGSIVGETKSGPATDKYAVEFITPPLHYSDIELLQKIIRSFKKAGAITNSSCGIHIHVDGSNHTPSSLKKMVDFMISRQDLIYEALEINSRSVKWCQKLNSKILHELKNSGNLTINAIEKIWYSPANDNYSDGISREHYNSTRYHGINLHAFFTKGTIEFRLFNSTLDADKVRAYIQFCLAVSAWAITSNEKILFRSMEGYTPKQKVTIMRNILTKRLGLYGNEFRICRLHLMTPLKKTANMA